MAKGKKAFYGVHRGHTPGVYLEWEDKENPSNPSTAKAQTDGFPKPRFKGFKTRQAAEHFYLTGEDIENGTLGSAGGTNGAGGSGPVRSVGGIRSASTPYQSARPGNTNGEGSSRAVATGGVVESGKNNSHPKGGPDIVAWTDGSCLGNGQAGARAGSGVYWEQMEGGPQVPKDIAERLPGAEQTNQRAELYAIVRALENEPERSARLTIRTDSNWSKNCVTAWLDNWKRKAGPDDVYRTANNDLVSHQDLIKYIDALLQQRESYIRNGVHFEWVKGHAGAQGNVKADALANVGARLPEAPERDYASRVAELRGPRRGPMDAFVKPSKGGLTPAAGLPGARGVGAAAASAAVGGLGVDGAEDWMLADAAELEDEVNGL